MGDILDILDNKQGMNVISRSTLAKCSSKLAGSYTPLGWRHYTDEEKARHSAYFKGIAAQIDALGPYPDPDAVDQIIGNDTWTCCRCDHCGSKVEYVVQINFSASRITNLCANCIRKAMAIVEDQPSKSLSFWTKHLRSTSSCGSSGLTGEEREAVWSAAYIRHENEQNARIDSLEAEITRLRAEVERLHDDLRFWQSRVSGETVAFIEFDADAKEEK